jgi:hypothetical protein
MTCGRMLHCPRWIRTTILGSKVRCPAIGRGGKRPAAAANEQKGAALSAIIAQSAMRRDFAPSGDCSGRHSPSNKPAWPAQVNSRRAARAARYRIPATAEIVALDRRAQSSRSTRSMRSLVRVRTTVAPVVRTTADGSGYSSNTPNTADPDPASIARIGSIDSMTATSSAIRG